MLYKLFEKITKAYPEKKVEAAPDTFIKYVKYYSTGMGVPIGIMSVLTALVAIMEISLFGFMGQLIDWIVTSDPKTLLDEHKSKIIWMSIVCVVVLPIVTWLHYCE